MTALLAKLGLSLAQGKSLWPLVSVLALLAALMGGALYGVHYLSGLGYNKAMAECREAANVALKQKHEAETQLAEANREVIIRHTADTVKLAAAAPKMKTEVIKYVEKTPSVSQCGLDADGLRIWNAAANANATVLDR